MVRPFDGPRGTELQNGRTRYAPFSACAKWLSDSPHKIHFTSLDITLVEIFQYVSEEDERGRGCVAKVTTADHGSGSGVAPKWI